MVNQLDIYGAMKSIDADFLADFIDSVNEVFSELEKNLACLERDSHNGKYIDILFRGTHELKVDFRVAGLDPLVSYSHSLENLLSEIRSRHMPLYPGLIEILLYSYDTLKLVCDNAVSQQIADLTNLDKVKKYIDQLTVSPVETLESLIATILGDLHHQVELWGEELSSDSVCAGPTDEESPQRISSAYQQDEYQDCADQKAFETWSRLADDRSSIWENRTEIKRTLALEINKQRREPVDQRQLVSAVYMHDIAMAMLPEYLLMKEGKYNAIETMQIHQHPVVMSEVCARLGGWEEAAIMIRQHHERYDGRGYPDKLSGDQIHPGAQIIAVVDSYYAMTHVRPDRDFKKSKLRAMTEIAQCHGTLYSREAVEAFYLAVSDSKY